MACADTIVTRDNLRSSLDNLTAYQVTHYQEYIISEPKQHNLPQIRENN